MYICFFKSLHHINEMSYIKKILFLFGFIFLISTTQSCFSKGYGCPGENASVKMKKDGSLPTRKGKSNLFNRKMRKRIKKHKRK